MKRYGLAFIYIIIIVLVIEPVFTINVMAKENDSSSVQDIGNKIEQYVDENIDTTAGMSVAVFNENKTVYQKCFGYMDVENKIPVTEDTVMEWGSVSKLLVWISAMQLTEQGKIDLDADVNTYLPEGFLHNREYDTPVATCQVHIHHFSSLFLGLRCFPCSKSWSITRFSLSSTLWVLVSEKCTSTK